MKNTIRNLFNSHLHFYYVLASKRLSRCTGEAIYTVILSTIQKFELATNQVVMFVTDARSSMPFAIRFLKHKCAISLHVTGLLQALHLVAETISKLDVDGLLSSTKKVS